ncbi:heterokaryon incompatibility protein-domain-containing protein, partial [Pyrenochaeta sp. MPI-SDFR-AT-0127]
MGRSTLQPIQPQVDLRLARRWLDFCVQEHWRRCQGSKKRVIDLMVIDCENRVIVPLPARGNYVTLSYVWGNHPEQERSSLQESSLPVPLPQTIEDAITVTKGLGYNYLWVDKYCIDQRKEDFHTKLRQMDVIYENSVLTIIAAAGSHSSYGLAGISKIRKSCSTQRLKSLPFLVADELRKSVWASRAWTFQEGLLSTRRLIFTEKQMYFECQGLYCFE